MTIPGDDEIHKPYVKNYKIEILPCGLKARFWISITTKNLLNRIKENPSKLFQIDGTYKLIYIPDKAKEGWSVQVHGTSNKVNEFFPTGLIITSDETAQTYKEIFESLETTFEYSSFSVVPAIWEASSYGFISTRQYPDPR